MKNYSIDFFSKDSFNHLEKIWKKLEDGKEMSMFQTYEWYKMLVEKALPDDSKFYETCFAVVWEEAIPVLIAPLWVVKHNFRFVNKKGIYFIGKEGWSDYLNCIYDRVDVNLLSFFFTSVSKKYNINYFHFNNLLRETVLYKYIKDNLFIINENSEVCVCVELPISIEDYNLMLTKNTKQNLRTANNRLIKDNHIITCIFDDINVDKSRCAEIRNIRLANKLGSISSFRKFKNRMINKMYFHFPGYFPMNDFYGSKIMSLYIDGELSAFFNYMIDNKNNSVIVMTAGTNLDYARYSPGMVLISSYIQKQIEERRIRKIDFTRGDEQYKYNLGGKEHFISNIAFEVHQMLTSR